MNEQEALDEIKPDMTIDDAIAVIDAIHDHPLLNVG